MGSQKKITEVTMNQLEAQKMKRILDLEKKYQNLLWGIFSSSNFKNDLLEIEREIQINYAFLTDNYDIKNKLKIPAERLSRYYIYNPNLNNNLGVLSIFPSPLSGDLAFITCDAVVNIDIKTLDINGNKTDIGNLQYLPNQSSFIHKNVGMHPTNRNSGINVVSILPKEYKGKPVLTFFVTIVYNDNPTQNTFSISRSRTYETIHLINLPNGHTSPLFDFELLDNFKTYSYFKEKHGFKPILLLANSNLPSANAEVERLYSLDSRYSIFSMGTKKALLDLNRTHPIYNTFITWVPVSRKNGNQFDFYLEAISSGDTNRINEAKLKVRYDSTDSEWEGLKTCTY